MARSLLAFPLSLLVAWVLLTVAVRIHKGDEARGRLTAPAFVNRTPHLLRRIPIASGVQERSYSALMRWFPPLPLRSKTHRLLSRNVTASRIQ
jgi:hypothetical protein